MGPKQFRAIIEEELEPIKKTLDEHTKKLDGITLELHEVHELADITVDMVKGRYEKNKAEIDEIKDHLGLPKKPYFGDQP